MYEELDQRLSKATNMQVSQLEQIKESVGKKYHA